MQKLIEGCLFWHENIQRMLFLVEMNTKNWHYWILKALTLHLPNFLQEFLDIVEFDPLEQNFSKHCFLSSELTFIKLTKSMLSVYNSREGLYDGELILRYLKLLYAHFLMLFYINWLVKLLKRCLRRLRLRCKYHLYVLLWGSVVCRGSMIWR